MPSVPNDKFGRPQTVLDILKKEAMEKKQLSEIGKIMMGTAMGTKNWTTDQKTKYLYEAGLGDKIDDWYISKFKNTSPKHRASWIMSQKQPDFTKLYKQKVLTLSVAKELQARGFIPDAKSLMKKLKLTDVYQQQEAIKSLDKKFIKSILKEYKREQDQARKLKYRGISKMLKLMGRRSKRRTLKLPRYTAPSKLNLPKAKMYKITKPKVKFKL